MPPSNNSTGSTPQPNQVPTQPRSSQLPQPTSELTQAPLQPEHPQATYPTAQPTVATPYSPAPSGPEQSSAGRYDFFLEPKKAPKKSLLPMSGSGSGTSSLLKWFIIVIISMFVLAGLIFAISNGGKDKTPVLTSLAKSQQLIINTSNAGLETLDSRSLYNFATTAKVTTISDQREVLALIKESGGKVDSKLLAKYTDPQVDQALDAAQAAGTYDTTYHTTMQSILKDYQAQLQQIYDTSPSARQHKIAEKNLESVQLLLQMLSQ